MVHNEPEFLKVYCVAFATNVPEHFLLSAVKAGIYGEFVSAMMHGQRLWDYVNAPENSYSEHFHDANGNESEFTYNGSAWYLFEN